LNLISKLGNNHKPPECESVQEVFLFIVIRVGRKTPRSGRKEMTNLGQEEIANSPVSEFLI